MQARYAGLFIAGSLSALAACGDTPSAAGPQAGASSQGRSGTGGDPGAQGGQQAAAAHGGTSMAGTGAGAGAGSGGMSEPTYEGGGGMGGASGQVGVPSPSTQQTFPVGLALGSPVAVVPSVSHARLMMQPGLWRRMLDYGRTARRAFMDADFGRLAQLGGRLLPVSTAEAAPSDQIELRALAGEVSELLAGVNGSSLAERLDLGRMFGAGGNANCYGPSLDYAHHEDATMGADTGMLPGGDLGLWLEHEGPTQPCVAAQLNRRIDGVKGQAQQGLLLMAGIRRLLTDSMELALPEPGATVDVTQQLAAELHMAPKLAGLSVVDASLSLDAEGAVYTYRFVFDSGAAGAEARTGEIVLQHTPGATSSEYTGVLRIAGFSLSADHARGCEDAKDGSGLYQVADVSTLRYSRSGAALAFSSRAGNYCGHPATLDAPALATEVASFDGAGELDASVKLASPMPPSSAWQRGSTRGWLGNFSRFAGDFDLETVEGDFLYAWQAGTQDGYSRMLALDVDFNTATGERSLQGFFGFASDIQQGDGSMLGMICNWAGPGNQHQPLPLFQSQQARMSAGALDFVIPAGGSKITYAPTNSCSSTTTGFDQDLSGTIESGEGEGVTAQLDAPSTGKTVAEELMLRGFAIPTLFD